MRYFFRIAVCLCAVSVLVAGCKRGSGAAQNTAAAGELKTFPIRGKVISVDAGKGSIVLQHEAVPGFMDAMTMPYDLKDPTVAGELHPGDTITAKLLVDKVGDEYLHARLDEIVVTGQARPDYKPMMQYHVPAAGDVVPDFKLTNEEGRRIHLGEFKGRVLLLTFIYTRCPLADFCPRMNKNFAEIDKSLAADPEMYRKTHLLSISFDPKYDTPEVLKRYGEFYTGGNSKTFAHWDFASAPEAELPAIEEFFDLGVTPGTPGTLVHSLSTAVVGKDGKIRAWYATNDWSPAQVLAELKTAAAA